MTDASKPLTTAQVARELGVTRQTVLAWAKEGLVPHWVLLNGHLRYDRATIERLRDEQLERRVG